MTLGRLIGIAATIVLVAGLLGVLSFDAEMLAATVAAEEGRPEYGAQMTAVRKQPTVLEARLLPEGAEVLLMPDVQAVLFRDGVELEPAEGAFVFEDGELYTFEFGKRKRIWLYAVVAEDEPRVSLTDG